MLDDLDLGESESIVLAIEKEANYLIIDEYLGRKIAHSMNIKVVGILGVLILAKHEGLLLEIRTCVKALLTVGFRLNRDLINSVFESLGETKI